MNFLTSKAFETLVLPLITLGLTQLFKSLIKYLKSDENNNGTPDLIEKLPSAWQGVINNIINGVKEDVCSYAIQKEIVKPEEAGELANAIDKALNTAPIN